MGALKRDQILQAKDLTFEPVAVPQWGGEVYLRPMSGIERGQWEKDNIEYKEVRDTTSKNGYRISTQLKQDSVGKARAIALVIVDPDTGERLFQDEKEILELAGKSAAALEVLHEKFLAMNGLSKKEEDEIKKTSEPTPDDASASGLH